MRTCALRTHRELKDKLAKAAEETEYRLYEKEQEIRREVVAELERNQKEGEVRARADAGVKLTGRRQGIW